MGLENKAVQLSEVNPSEHETELNLDSAITIKDWLALLSIALVGILNRVFTNLIPNWYEGGFDFTKIGLEVYGNVETSKVVSIWSLQLALIIAIIVTIALNFSNIKDKYKDGLKVGISGALLASVTTASEFGFGAVIAALPGFTAVQNFITGVFENPVINGAVTTTTLAGITGSGSGGISITLGLMADQYITAANNAGIPLEAMHRILSMASGGLDTLPHNGAIIVLLTVCGLTHKQAYAPIFGITIIKTMAVAFAILLFSLFSII